MSLKVRSAPLNLHQRNVMIKKVISSSALGYLSGKIFTAINPISAGIFNFTAEITDYLTSEFFKKINFLKNSKTTKEFIKLVISFSTAFFVVNTIGKFTVLQAFKITTFTIVTQIAIANIFGLTVAMGSFAILANKTIFKFLRN